MSFELLSGLLGLAFVGFIAWSMRSKGGSSTGEAPPGVSDEDIARLEAFGNRAALGEELSEDEMDTVDDIMSALYAHLSYFNDTDDNTAWRVEDQHRFFRAGCYAAATEHPRHSAWPVGAPFRRAIASKLRAEADCTPTAPRSTGGRPSARLGPI